MAPKKLQPARKPPCLADPDRWAEGGNDPSSKACAADVHVGGCAPERRWRRLLPWVCGRECTCRRTVAGGVRAASVALIGCLRRAPRRRRRAASAGDGTDVRVVRVSSRARRNGWVTDCRAQPSADHQHTDRAAPALCIASAADCAFEPVVHTSSIISTWRSIAELAGFTANLPARRRQSHRASRPGVRTESTIMPIDCSDRHQRMNADPVCEGRNDGPYRDGHPQPPHQNTSHAGGSPVSTALRQTLRELYSSCANRVVLVGAQHLQPTLRRGRRQPNGATGIGDVHNTSMCGAPPTELVTAHRCGAHPTGARCALSITKSNEEIRAEANVLIRLSPPSVPRVTSTEPAYWARARRN